MKAFGYVAYTEDGKRRAGSVIAETEAHATDILKGQGLFVSDLKDRGDRTRSARRLWVGRRTLNADLQSVLTRQMAVLLAAELTAEAALEAVRASGSSPSMETVAARAKAALLEGTPLSDALDQSGAGFPLYYVAAVRAGERSGDLQAVFDELANHLETRGTDRAQIGAALVYPAFVASVSLLVCGILMVNVAPEIVGIFEMSGRPLPGITRTVLDISNWVLGHLPLIGVALAAFALLLWLSSRLQPLRDARDGLFLRVPIVGRLMRLSASVQYLRTLGLVLTSRHAVLNAADSAATVLQVSRFRAEAVAVSKAIRTGESLSQAMSRLSFIPPVARQLISAGEASARLGKMTERSAVLVENGLSIERKRIAALLEPMLMMLVGAFVLVVVLAVLLPIFDLQEVVGG